MKHFTRNDIGVTLGVVGLRFLIVCGFGLLGAFLDVFFMIYAYIIGNYFEMALKILHIAGFVIIAGLLAGVVLFFAGITISYTNNKDPKQDFDEAFNRNNEIEEE